MPSERAKRAAEITFNAIEGQKFVEPNERLIFDVIVCAISSEYADLEAYVEYVERVVLCDRAQSGETMPSFLSLGELLTFPEWKKDKRK